MTLLEKYQEYPRKTKINVSEDIVFSLLSELDGRKGVLDFDNCDYDIQEEILDCLVDIVDSKLIKKEIVIELSKYGEILVDDNTKEMYSEIKKELTLNECVVVSFEGVQTLQTTVAKNVFGRLYSELGNVNYNTMIKLKGASKTHMMIIHLGIADTFKTEE